jgi:hypothetical protein
MSAESEVVSVRNSELEAFSKLKALKSSLP